MPICTNPKCGQITKIMSLYCPSCGQQTLSKVDRGQVDGPHSSEISMENFDRITADVPAPHEKLKWGRSQRKKRSRKVNLNNLPSKVIFFFIVLGVIFSALPGSLKDPVYQKFGFQQRFSLDFQEDDNGFKFIEYADNGVPAYFKGCGPIDYFVRQNYASSEDLSLIGEAMSEISTGFGRSFKFQGFTENRDVSKLPEGILIDFTSSSEFQEELRSSTSPHVDAAGLGGPDQYENTNKPRFGSLAYARGTVWINEEYWSSLESRYKVHVLTHELGHVLGLSHPTNGWGQLMGDLNESYELSSLGSGDLMGLQILSALAGCRDFPEYLTQASSQDSTAANNSDQVWTFNCEVPDQRPELILFSCGSGGVGVSDIKWTSWSSRGATGTGIYFEKQCEPNCIDGYYLNVPVTIALSDLFPYKGKNMLLTLDIQAIGGREFPGGGTKMTRDLADFAFSMD